MVGAAVASTLAGLAAASFFLSPAVRRRFASTIALRAVASETAPLTGILFRYKKASWPAPLQAFESPIGHTHDKYCVYVGGLTDGLLVLLWLLLLRLLLLSSKPIR